MIRATRQPFLLGALAFGVVSAVASAAEYSGASASEHQHSFALSQPGAGAPASPNHQHSFELSQPEGAALATPAAPDEHQAGLEKSIPDELAHASDSPPGAELPFRLTDHTGAPFDREALSGHFTLVYFGYTHCTDVCPIGLSVMASTLREMPDYAGQVEGAFITVDPARDSAETLQKYVGYFHPAICGVRGTAEETARAADYFEIVFRHGAQNGTPTVEHSDTIIVLDENGIEQKRFPGSTRPSIIRSELTAMLAQSDNNHQKR